MSNMYILKLKSWNLIYKIKKIVISKGIKQNNSKSTHLYNIYNRLGNCPKLKLIIFPKDSLWVE